MNVSFLPVFTVNIRRYSNCLHRLYSGREFIGDLRLVLTDSCTVGIRSYIYASFLPFFTDRIHEFYENITLSDWQVLTGGIKVGNCPVTTSC